MHELYLQYIRVHTEWLACVVYEYKWFYYDLWSFVHMWSGAMIFVILTAYKYKKRWSKLLLLVILFEVYEATIAIGIFHIFKPEKSIDVIHDIVNGMIGGFLIYSFFKWNNNRRYTVWLAAFVSSIVIAWVWVGSYGYSYNIAFFNSDCMNWWTLIVWTVGGTAVSLIFNALREKTNIFYSLFLTWLIYIICFVAIESIAYHLLSFKEISKDTSALVFNIIHGNIESYIFYLSSPIYFTALFVLFLWLFRKYETSVNADSTTLITQQHTP